MGYQTYLSFDGGVALQWRGYASTLPRMLFRFDDLELRTDDDGDPMVLFETTGHRALENLEEAGFGWEACIAMYHQLRSPVGEIEGMLEYLAWERPNDDEIRQRYAEATPEQDLTALGGEIARQWSEESVDEVFFLSHLTFDGDLPEPFNASRELRAQMDKSHEFPLNSLLAMRAAYHLALLYKESPLLTWPIVMSVIVKGLPDETNIELDLTDDARTMLDYEGCGSCEEYVAEYWESSTNTLANHGSLMSSLWGTLGAFGSKVGPEYSMARAAALLGQIQADVSPAERSSNEKGKILEDLVEALVQAHSPEVAICEKNLKTSTGELDLLLSNGLKDPFWNSIGSPFIMVECKNWNKRVDVDEIRVLESKMREAAAVCRIGLFVSTSGFTRPFLEMSRSLTNTLGLIVTIDGSDLESMISSRTPIFDWIRANSLSKPMKGR